MSAKLMFESQFREVLQKYEGLPVCSGVIEEITKDLDTMLRRLSDQMEEDDGY